MLIYDNLEDARAKLVATMCYYKGKAVLIKEVYHATEAYDAGMISKEYNEGKKPTPGEFCVVATTPEGRTKTCFLLSDPDFNYMDFTLGYANHNQAAVYWYRQPIKQFRQGLKDGQLGYNVSNKAFKGAMGFEFGRPIADMMEGVYPKFNDAVSTVKSGEHVIVAFHRDFAVSWDKVHEDIILEYKGRLVGHGTSVHNFKLMEGCNHLAEALKEAVA